MSLRCQIVIVTRWTSTFHLLQDVSLNYKNISLNPSDGKITSLSNYKYSFGAVSSISTHAILQIKVIFLWIQPSLRDRPDRFCNNEMQIRRRRFIFESQILLSWRIAVTVLAGRYVCISHVPQITRSWTQTTSVHTDIQYRTNNQTALTAHTRIHHDPEEFLLPYGTHSFIAQIAVAPTDSHPHQLINQLIN